MGRCVLIAVLGGAAITILPQLTGQMFGQNSLGRGVISWHQADQLVPESQGNRLFLALTVTRWHMSAQI